MQSGSHQQKKWKVDFDNRERWENTLIGYAANGDPFSSLQLEFSSKEDAIIYCERMGIFCRFYLSFLFNKVFHTLYYCVLKVLIIQ